MSASFSEEPNEPANARKWQKNRLDGLASSAGRFSTKVIYQTYDFSAEDITGLLADILQSKQSFVESVSLRFFSDEQFIHANVALQSFLRYFSFDTKIRLTDIWHDNQTSTAVCEFIDINVHFISLLPKRLQRWCGQQLISLISFWGAFVQKSSDTQRARLYLQGQFLYIDFRPWIISHMNSDGEPAGNHWLYRLFREENPRRVKKYLRNHIMFGAEITEDAQLLRVYMYHTPYALYKNTVFSDGGADYQEPFENSWLEWLFAIITSFLLVSFLVPFGMAYVKLAPFDSANLFSLPLIFIYNTIIVLIPFFIFRIVLIPMRRLWTSRSGRIDILKAEIARDQVFMPLLREWIVWLQAAENVPFPHRLIRRISVFLGKIGTQKFYLVNKIRLIEKRRLWYANIIICSYVGICLIEILFLTGVLPTPQFLASSINRLLEWIFLE